MTEVMTQLLSIAPERAGKHEFSQLELVWEALREGRIRAAEQRGEHWVANTLVKRVILWAFRAGVLESVPAPNGERVFAFTDKHTLPVQRFTAESDRRIVPGGSSIRDAAYVAPGVIVMPPSYINIGAFVDENTLVDSHALVGSCAQIGKNVHLSAAVQIGGVLEPVGAVPVVVEDNVMVGGNSGIYEGTVVKRGAVIGTGVILTGSTPVYDLVHETVLRKDAESPLVIPENAVVVQGSRPARGRFAEREGVHVYTPVIVKYRDNRTDAATALEQALR